MCHFKCKAHNWESSLSQPYKSFHWGFKVNPKPNSLIVTFVGEITKLHFFLRITYDQATRSKNH